MHWMHHWIFAFERRRDSVSNPLFGRLCLFRPYRESDADVLMPRNRRFDKSASRLIGACGLSQNKEIKNKALPIVKLIHSFRLIP